MLVELFVLPLNVLCSESADLIGHRIDGLDQNHFLLFAPSIHHQVVLNQVLLKVPIQRQNK
jgi:hypothetical protein